MQYFLLPIFYVIYFELLGQSIMNMVGWKKTFFGMPFGLFGFFAVMYVVTFPITLFALSSLVLDVVTLVLVLIGVFVIFKNRKCISFNKWYLLVIAAVLVQIYMIKDHTLGDLLHLDSLWFTNKISGNIKIDHLNYANINPSGGIKGYDIDDWSMQSFYLFISANLYFMRVARVIFHLVSIDFLNYPALFWFSTIIAFFVKIIVLIDVVNYLKIKNKVTLALIVSMILLTHGVQWYQMELAYIPHSLRFYYCAYMCMFAYDYLKSDCKDRLPLKLFTLVCFGGCAISNVQLVIPALFSFILYIFVYKKDNKALKYLIVAFTPGIMNLAVSYLNNIKKSSIAALAILVVFSLLFILSEKINSLLVKYNGGKYLLIGITALFIIFGFVSGKPFYDMEYFWETIYRGGDMVWVFYIFTDPYISICNIIWLASLLILMLDDKNEFNKIPLLFMLIFVSPISCRLWKLAGLGVYYRNADAVINCFTFSLACLTLEKKFKKTATPISLALAGVILFCSYGMSNTGAFIPHIKESDSYDWVRRMSDDEFKTEMFVLNYVNNNEMPSYNLISHIYQITTENPYFTNVYYRFNYCYYSNVCKVFYKADYFEDPFRPDYNWDEAENVLENMFYQIIIIRNDISYGKEKEEGLLQDIVERSNLYDLAYENGTYDVFVLR